MLLTCAAHTLALVTSLAASAWQGELPLPADCQQTSHFLGFSANERAYAQRIDAVCHPSATHQDRFSLVVLVDAEQGIAVGLFRAGTLRREQGAHQPVAHSNQAQSRYPLYKRALSAASWNKTARLGHFAFVRHDFADDVVRVRPIGAAAIDVRKQGDAIAIAAQGANNARISVLVRLMDGTQQEVAVLQLPNARPSTLRLFYSKAGNRVAIACSSHWTVPTEQLASPVSSTHLGAPNTMAWEERNVQQLYKSLHPRGMTNWNDYVGNIL